MAASPKCQIGRDKSERAKRQSSTKEFVDLYCKETMDDFDTGSRESSESKATPSASSSSSMPIPKPKPLDAKRTASYAFFEHVRNVFETPEETAITLRLLQLSGDRLSMKTKEQLVAITTKGIRSIKDIETCGEIAMALEEAILATQQRIADRQHKAVLKQQAILEEQRMKEEDDHSDMPVLTRIDSEEASE
ncbi:hypothetical protein L596_011797 [Steinernema carpocapsae]|uniref:Uncharacterized protein n=1 Tax=Steinernema carpocapsae TaxID=34508 RepID=A0A4U5NVZ6_STECR|nr:hypothetical protein L596_011797 [Steinernema carpocapsae]